MDEWVLITVLAASSAAGRELGCIQKGQTRARRLLATGLLALSGEVLGHG